MRKLLKKMGAVSLAAAMTLSGIPQGIAAAQQEKEASADLTAGLVGYWTFDGATQEERLANHAQGQTLTAEAQGAGVTFSDDGISQGAAYFSKRENSHIRLNLTQANLGMNTSSNDFTVAAWVKYDENPFNGNENICLFQQSGGGRTVLYLTPGKKYGTFLTGTNVNCEEELSVNTWSHVAITCSASTKRMKIYVDGSIVKDTVLTGDFVNEATDFLVGAHKNGAANSAMKGYVDELRYYNKVVDAAAVEAMYDAFAAVPLKSRLEGLVQEAKGLTGASDPNAETALQEKITAAEGLLDQEGASASEFYAMLDGLKEAMDRYTAAAPIMITVDKSDEIRRIPDAMFGINHRYHRDAYGGWDRENQTVFPEFTDLVKKADFGSVRYPGGTVSNLFSWKDAVGPMEQRTATIAGNNFYGGSGDDQPVEPGFGVDEAMKWIYDDLGAEAIFVYGLGRGNPSDAADLVEYLNAPNDGSNPNGGVDWAARRADPNFGNHPKPYGVVRFEIGNEFSDTGQNYWMSGISENSKGTVDLYIEGDTMTISGQTSYYQTNNKVAKKGDWSAAASRSDGKPKEERYVYYLPVVEGSASVTVGGTAWEIVDTLEGQGAKNVCMFDYEQGKITFGDGTDGNIPSSGAEIRCNYKTKQGGFVDYYDAMKGVADEIGMEIEIYSGIVDRLQKQFVAKMREKGYNDKYDGIIIHPYSSGVVGYEQTLAKEKEFAEYIASNKQAMMDATDNDDSKKVAVSEFGILSPQSEYQTALGHAIYIANHMIDCVNAGAAYQNKHCLSDYDSGSDSLGAWTQSVIHCHTNEDGSYSYIVTPSAHLFSLFNYMSGNTQVAQEVVGNTAFYQTVDRINVYSTKDADGTAYVLVVNNDTSEAGVQIGLKDESLTGREIEIWSLGSEDVNDRNTLSEPNKVTVQKTSVKATGERLAYTLNKTTVYGFKIPEQTYAVTVESEGNGSVSGGRTGIVKGSEVTVTASADQGFVFAGWFNGGTKVSDSASYTFTVTENMQLSAKFIQDSNQSKVQDPDQNQDPGIRQPPAAPKGVKAKKAKKGIDLSWKAVGNADGYLIYRSYKKKKGYKAIATISNGNAKKYLDKKCKKGKMAYYKIKTFRMVDGNRIESGFSKMVKKKR